MPITAKDGARQRWRGGSRDERQQRRSTGDGIVAQL
jgi:hypothetical protein